MPPKKETKPPAKKRSPKPVKSKTSTDDTGPSFLINNLTLNRPPLSEYRDWSNQYVFPFLIKLTNFIAGLRNVIVDFQIIASAHENKIVIDVVNDGMYLPLASVLPDNFSKTDRIAKEYAI